MTVETQPSTRLVYGDISFPEVCADTCPQVQKWLRLTTAHHQGDRDEAVIKLEALAKIAESNSCQGPWDDQGDEAPMIYCSGNPNSNYGV